MTVKIKVSSGGFCLEYEGSEKFAETRLAPLAESIADLARAANANQGADTVSPSTSPLAETLAEYLKAPGSEPQHRIFLKTAAWLQLEGQNKLSTGNIIEALRVNKQNRLANASDSLATNVSQGFCEKTGSRTFRVTHAGFRELGPEMEAAMGRTEDG